MVHNRDMTRKHFIAIAAIIKARFDEVDSQAPGAADLDAGHDAGYLNALTETAENMADYFASENPNFDRARFLTACGL
jgi:hypothetical protein